MEKGVTDCGPDLGNLPVGGQSSKSPLPLTGFNGVRSQALGEEPGIWAEAVL